MVKTYAEVVDELEAATALVQAKRGDGSLPLPPLPPPGDFTWDTLTGAQLAAPQKPAKPPTFGLNGPATVEAKAGWAAGRGLAGIFFWEVGQDKLGHPHSLLAAAARASGVSGGGGAGERGVGGKGDEGEGGEAPRVEGNAEL